MKKVQASAVPYYKMQVNAETSLGVYICATTVFTFIYTIEIKIRFIKKIKARHISCTSVLCKFCFKLYFLMLSPHPYFAGS